MKWFIGFIATMVILYAFVTDGSILNIMNWLWIIFWIALFSIFTIFIYIPDLKHKRYLKKNKQDKEG